MKIKGNSFTLSNRESRRAGYHDVPMDAHELDDAKAFRREVLDAARAKARSTGRNVDVYATRRGMWPWLVETVS